MMRKRWIVLIASATALGLLLWWIATGNSRQLDEHVSQALERYEQAFAKDGARATPAPLRQDGYGPFLDVVFVEKVAVHPDGKTLTAKFIGGKPTGPCGVDYTARAVESEHAALIVVEKHPHDERARICPAMGYGRQASVRLSRLLGGRTVLEATRGMPVPVDLTR